MPAPTDPKPQATVFYSWQSDLPNSTNRSLIQEALEKAAKVIRSDDTLAVAPVIDRDTQNVPGAPDISQAIFQKIEEAAAFVADVSIINPGLGRPTPNPNVLIEVGYALKALRAPRIVLVANTANGPVEALPFDLRTKRVLTYHLLNGAGDKPEQRKRLQQGLEQALRAILADLDRYKVAAPPSLVDKAIESIEVGAPSQDSLSAKIIPAIADQVTALTPQLRREERDTWDDDLVRAIESSLPQITDFARVANAAATHASTNAAIGLFRGFEKLFSQYNLPPEFSGGFYDVQFDLPKFVGHELMVILFSALINENRWEIVAELCRQTVLVPNADGRSSSSTSVTYLYASEYVKLLDLRNDRLKLNRLSLHADILKERHEVGELGELAPWRQFQDADVFLYLRSTLADGDSDIWDAWRPWSAALLSRCPRYLLEAVDREKAERLMRVLGLRNLEEFRSRLKTSAEGLRRLFSRRHPFYSPLRDLDPNSIGTR